MHLDPSVLTSPLVAIPVTLALIVLALSERVAKSPLVGWVRAAVTWAAHRRDEREGADYRQLSKRVERLEDHMEQMRAELVAKEAELGQAFGYIAWSTAWARDVIVLVAAAVPPLQLPPFLSWSQWRAAHPSTAGPEVPDPTE